MTLSDSLNALASTPWRPLTVTLGGSGEPVKFLLKSRFSENHRSFTIVATDFVHMWAESVEEGDMMDKKIKESALEGLHFNVVTTFMGEIQRVMSDEAPVRESRIEINADKVPEGNFIHLSLTISQHIRVPEMVFSFTFDLRDVYRHNLRLAPLWFHEHITYPTLVTLEEERRRKRHYGELVEAKEQDLKVAARALKHNDVKINFRSAPFSTFEESEGVADGRFRLGVETLSSPEAMFGTESTRILYSIAAGKRRPVIGGDECASSIGISKTLPSPYSAAPLENDPIQSTPSSSAAFADPTSSQPQPSQALSGTQPTKRRKKDPKEEEEEQMERIRVVMAEERRLREEEQKKKAVRGKRGLR